MLWNGTQAPILVMIQSPAEWNLLVHDFAASSTCRNGGRPELMHEVGCTFIRCEKGKDCTCKDQDGGDVSPHALCLRWRRKYNKT